MEKEKYLSIESLFWKIVFAWRTLLIVAVVFALVLPFFRYVQDYKDYKTELMELEQLKSIEVEGYDERDRVISCLETYKKISLYMNANPVDTVTNEMEFVSKDIMLIEDVDKYIDYLHSDEFAMDFYKNQEIIEEEKAAYIVAIHHVMDVSYDILDDKSCSLRVSIDYEDDCKIGDTEWYYKDLVGFVKEVILEDNAFVLVSENIDRISIEDFRNIRNSIKFIWDEYYDDYNKINIAIENQNRVISMPNIEFELVVVGALIGIVIACVCIFIKLLFTKKLQGLDEITDIYGVNTIGIVGCEKNNDKRNRIDRFLYNQKYHKYLDIENMIDVATSNIKVGCQKNEIKKIYICSSINKRTLFDSNEYLKFVEILKKQNLDVVSGGNIVMNAQAYIDACEVGAVVLWEKLDESEYKDIETEINRLRESQVSVLGCVVVY